MFKNKTEQKRNDEKCNQTGITVKIHTNHDGVWANMIMLKSIATRSSWRSPVITVKQASETTSAALRVKKACSDILSDALSRKSHQSLQFFGAVIRLSFIQKALDLHSLFSTLSYEKTRVFLWAIIRLNFTSHFTPRFCIRDLKTSGKSVKFDLPNYFSL